MKEQSVGARIAALRAVRGVTGAELGQALGLTKSQVSKIENGTRKLDVSEVALVAEVLGVTLAEVLGVSRKGTLALAARVMSGPGQDETRPARRRVRQLLESEAALSDAVGLRPSTLSTAGATVMRRAEVELLTEGSPVRAGTRLAGIAREELGLGRAPIADLLALCERHFGLNAVVWPIGKAVSGLCAHGVDVALMLVSSSYPRGHQRFTGAHELAHHILRDPREVIVETDVFMVRTPAEQRANAFAAALLMPVDGLHEVIAGRPLDKGVLGELMREFDVSYRALVYRLADRSVRLLSDAQRDTWLAQTPTSVLRAAGDLTPHDLTTPDETRRLPPRLWMAAQQGYQNGRVGLGVLSSLLDEDPDILFARLADAGIQPPRRS
ncbi:hypothetical protein Aple_038570 [Acrocarpospora pleiomorpha]|uniref:HTH cro/C1-type domain-containing protein n=1 Tax=Acrocarpospora pleiomorpha TaxID=90975 RepID=A0A5M3XMT8_9ACTN|nr:ImmA/IrrE family metallo-endopeptidase [Acrocarpospora pleiomorpha]GES20961.1 hypothetical protein Aple_038570 [Acrocarpospora pleiomorpha]